VNSLFTARRQCREYAQQISNQTGSDVNLADIDSMNGTPQIGYRSGPSILIRMEGLNTKLTFSERPRSFCWPLSGVSQQA
jgi:hypothetical protein